MKLLLASWNSKLVERMSKELACNGVACEVRYRPATTRQFQTYRELWIEPDTELNWAASLLAMHCRVGRN